MSKAKFSRDDPLWISPHALLDTRKIIAGWFPIDGIEPVTGSSKHHQWLALGEGRRIWKNRRWVLKNTRDHLGIDASTWRYQRRFVLELIGVFLDKFRDHVVSVQVLPRRKTFHTLFVSNDKPSPQRLIYPPKFVLPATHIGDSSLSLAYGLSVPGQGLLMNGESPHDDSQGELFWTKVAVSRTVPGTSPINEFWSFLARPEDRERITSKNSVPILERFFNYETQTQEAPIVSFSAFAPGGGSLQTQCFHLHPESGMFLDVRQGRPTLEHSCVSAPQNHSGLRRLLYGEPGGF